MKLYCDLTFKYIVKGKYVQQLVTKHGFKFQSSTTGVSMTYRKEYPVPERAVTALAREANSICEPFIGVDGLIKNKEDLLRVLKNWANSKPNPVHKQWIEDWVKRNIEEPEGLPF